MNEQKDRELTSECLLFMLAACDSAGFTMDQIREALFLGAARVIGQVKHPNSSLLQGLCIGAADIFAAKAQVKP